MGDDYYRVTVRPEYGPAVTFHVRPSSGELIGWNGLGANRGYRVWDRRSVPRDQYVVKVALNSGSYFSAHKRFEDAIIAANRRARAYARMVTRRAPQAAAA